MSPADREEYERRLALRNARRAEIRAELGYTDAPPQPVRKPNARKGRTPPGAFGDGRWDAL